MIEIFKNQKNRSEFSIISESGNVFYLPSTLTVREVEEILYALYGEHVNWDKTAERNLTEDLGYEVRRYASQNPEKLLLEVFNINDLRAYAEEIYSEALWHDIQDAKEVEITKDFVKEENKMIYVSNAFSLQMLNIDKVNSIITSPLSVEEVKELLLTNDFISAVGHPDTAGILSGILEVNVPFNRINVTLTPGDVLIVAQLTGGRLPEGSTTLPEGFSFKFLKVELVS